MNTNIKWLIVLVIVAGIYFVTKPDRASSSFDRNFTNFTVENVSKLVITHEGNTAQIEKQNNAWQIDHYKANQAYVEDALNEIKNIQLARKVSSSADKHAEYELTEEKGTKVEIALGEDTVSFFVGKTGASYQNLFVRKMNDDIVYSTKSNFQSQLTRSITDWKDKTILNLQKNEIASIAINNDLFLVNKDSVVTIAGKNVKKQPEIEGSSDAFALLSTFENFNTLDFSHIQHSEPALTIEINQRNGDKHTLNFSHHPEKDDRYLVKKYPGPTVFEVSKSSFASFGKKYSELKK